MGTLISPSQMISSSSIMTMRRKAMSKAKAFLSEMRSKRQRKIDPLKCTLSKSLKVHLKKNFLKEPTNLQLSLLIIKPKLWRKANPLTWKRNSKRNWEGLSVRRRRNAAKRNSRQDKNEKSSDFWIKENSMQMKMMSRTTLSSSETQSGLRFSRASLS